MLETWIKSLFFFHYYNFSKFMDKCMFVYVLLTITLLENGGLREIYKTIGSKIDYLNHACQVGKNF